MVLWRRVPDRGLLVADFVFNGYQGRDIAQKKEPGATGGWVFVSGGESKGECPSPYFSHEVIRQNNKDLLITFRFQNPAESSKGKRPELELMYRPVTEADYRSGAMS